MFLIYLGTKILPKDIGDIIITVFRQLNEGLKEVQAKLEEKNREYYRNNN